MYPASESPVAAAMSASFRRLPIVVVSLPEDRVVGTRPFIVRAAVAVVIEGDRLAAHALGTGERRRVAMKRMVGGAEHDGAVEDRQDPLLTAHHLAIPQLEMAAVFLLPIAVQIDQQIEPAVEAQFGMPIEIGVHLEKAAGQDLVWPGASVVGVRNEAVDPGQRLQELQNRHRVHVQQEITQMLLERRRVAVAELLLGGIVESRPIDLSWPR